MIWITVTFVEGSSVRLIVHLNRTAKSSHSRWLRIYWRVHALRAAELVDLSLQIPVHDILSRLPAHTAFRDGSNIGDVGKLRAAETFLLLQLEFHTTGIWEISGLTLSFAMRKEMRTRMDQGEAGNAVVLQTTRSNAEFSEYTGIVTFLTINRVVDKRLELNL